MTPMITQNGQPIPTGQTPLRTPVRDKLNINQPDDMDPGMYESFEQVRKQTWKSKYLTYENQNLKGQWI